MKYYFDSFYEIIHKNSVKRRRMVSMLLVLSIFVSSGVLWELRDTVITMVNEPICGYEEHTHTDECYEYRLVCGLEENEEHTHTEDCYEKFLICGYEEHLHTALCYTDEETNAQKISEDESAEIVSIELPEDGEEELISAFDAEIDDSLVMGNMSLTALDGETSASAASHDPANPVPLNDTIDNIAKGIKFTLFDYGNNELEGSSNNYNIEWDPTSQTWIHPHYNGETIKSGWKDVGINTGKDPETDIMFFAYGTPAFRGTLTTDDDDDPNKIYTRYDPDKNNYSGDYNVYDGHSISGNRPVQGIVNTQLNGNGYPTISGSNSSLEYLFSTSVTDNDKSYKSVYENVNRLLRVNNSGHLYFNSNENYAYYDQTTGEFIVYDTTFDIVNENHHYGTDNLPNSEQTYASLIPEEEYDAVTNNGDKDPGFKIGFFPFDAYDYSKRDPNFNTKNNPYNHHFGMIMEAAFDNPVPTDENHIANDPVAFKYSGDDDMWVFVDGVLVLDIGGIHEPAAGMIDFTNGLVWTQDNEKGKTAEQAYNELRTNNSALPLFGAITAPDNGVNTDGRSESLWKVETIASKFVGISDKSCDAHDGKVHSIKMFYLERGGCYSNLAMEINLPTVRPLSVIKNVDDSSPYEYTGKTYDYEIWKYDGSKFDRVNLGNADTPIYSFSVGAGERVDIPNLPADTKYRVVETGVDPNIMSEVSIRASEATNGSAVLTENYVGAEDIVGLSYGSEIPLDGYYDLNTYNIYEFTNIVRKEFTDLKVTKSWSDYPSNLHEDDIIKFKLYQKDSKTGAELPVEYGGKMTFTIKKDEQGKSEFLFEDLPKRYGDHFYTYSVVEQNVPNGYEAVYGKDSEGNLTITNTASSNAEINVKKVWKNTPNSEAMSVDLTLKRKVAALSENNSASLTINLRDARSDQYNNIPTDNIIKTQTITAAENKLAVGGSVEFGLELPNGVDYYSFDADYGGKYYKTTDGLVLKRLSGNYFEVSNLKAGENIVDIKVSTDDAEDNLLLLHHSFTKMTDGWQRNGIPEKTDNKYNLETSGSSNYAKNDGLLVRGRTDHWNGAKLYLDRAKFQINETYTFSVYVKYDNNASYPDNVNFVMTFNDGLESNDSYKRIKVQTVQKDQWTQIIGTFTIPSSINPYGMFLLIETDTNNPDIVKTMPYRMDEFIAVKGNKDISVEEGTGTVSVMPLIYNDTFGYNDYNDWVPNNNATLSIDHFNSDYYVLASNRGSDPAAGMKKYVPLLVPGKRYRFIANLSGNDETSTHNYVLSIDKVNLDSSNANWTNFKNIANTGNIKGYGWGNINTIYTIPSEAVQDQMYLYFETAQGSKDYEPFRLWDFKASEDIDSLSDEVGYSLSNGVYTSNNDLYQIAIDTNSAIAPINYDAYTEDTGFSRPITLSDANNWKYQWLKSQLGETSGNRYIYYIEETSVNNNGTLIQITNTDHKSGSADDYLVTYIGNDVAANDADDPIVVENAYIWYKLPATGGHGSRRIYLFGAVFTVVGTISLSVLYRRRRKRGDIVP